MSWLGSTVATAKEPRVNKRMITIEAMRIAAGNCLFGLRHFVGVHRVHLDAGEQQDDAGKKGDVADPADHGENSGDAGGRRPST